jgi:hypothetical protein
VEGQSRIEFGTLSPRDFRPAGKDSRIRAKLVEGPFKGAFVYQAYSAEQEVVSPLPVPQIGFRQKRSENYVYYPIDEVPTSAELTDLGWDEKHPESIRALEVPVDVVSETLARRGIPFQHGGDLCERPSDQPLSVLTAEVESTIDLTIQRAVAKIAFNYLARWERAEFARHSGFDHIRNFVRHGQRPPYSLVVVTNESILKDEGGSADRRVGHIITINWAADGESIVAQLSLFNWFKYSICLARAFRGERRPISRGHFFNIADRQILPLGRRSASERET